MVYTRAPKPAGRGKQERKTPVHDTAEALGLPVITSTQKSRLETGSWQYRHLPFVESQLRMGLRSTDLRVWLQVGQILCAGLTNEIRRGNR